MYVDKNMNMACAYIKPWKCYLLPFCFDIMM